MATRVSAYRDGLQGHAQAGQTQGNRGAGVSVDVCGCGLLSYM